MERFLVGKVDLLRVEACPEVLAGAEGFSSLASGESRDVGRVCEALESVGVESGTNEAEIGRRPQSRAKGQRGWARPRGCRAWVERARCVFQTLLKEPGHVCKPDHVRFCDGG